MKSIFETFFAEAIVYVFDPSGTFNTLFFIPSSIFSFSLSVSLSDSALETNDSISAFRHIFLLFLSFFFSSHFLVLPFGIVCCFVRAGE